MERPASQRNIFSQSTIRLRKQRLPDGKDGHDKNMKSPTRLQQNRAGRTSISRLASFFCLAVFLLFAVTANAQNVTQLNVPTTTTLWAGTQDWNQFGLSSVTAPASGIILPGTAISSFTGQPVRHLWYGDQSNGMCRIDPEVDDPNLTQPSPGIGRFNNIERTCVGFIQAGGFAP